jgi:hypothetical protein
MESRWEETDFDEDRWDAPALEEERYLRRTPVGARFAAGVVAGGIGSLLMLGFMMGYAQYKGAGLMTPLKALGAFVYGVEALVAGPEAMLMGALLQIGASIALGILFALFVSRRTSTLAAGFAGTVVGIIVWVAMELVVLPSENPTMAARVALMPLAYFVAHLLYGVGLGTTPVFVRTFTKERHRRERLRYERSRSAPSRDHRGSHAMQTQPL